MIRELTKSALSFSWALSLLGAKQAVNLGRPRQQSGGGDLFAPVTQSAVGQLDESMKGIYRSGDNLGSRMVDLAFCWINPLNWFNPGSWGNMANWANPGNWVNPANWVNPNNWVRPMTNCTETSGGCGCSAPGGQQQSAPGGGTGATGMPDNSGAWGPPRTGQ